VFSAVFRVGKHRAGPAARAGGDGPREGSRVESVPQVTPVTKVSEEHLSSPGELAALVTALGEPFVLAGDGALRYSEMLCPLPGARLASAALSSPPVAVLAAVGVARLSAGLGLEAAEIAPLYLRDADARIHWEQRLPPQEPSAPGA
jgi:tRNA A37 threonylcarbamoyladenosine modification protein TsaB